MGKETARRPAGAADSQSMGRSSPILAIDDEKLVLAATDRMNHLVRAQLTQQWLASARGLIASSSLLQVREPMRPTTGRSVLLRGRLR